MFRNFNKNDLLSLLFSFHFILAISFISIIALLIVVLPTFIVDTFLAISIASSIFLFLMAIYIKRPLDFTILPFVLLIVTLFRLALNIASTRLILLNGTEDGSHAAGEVIYNFGNFVIGSNYVVGLIIFSILVIINILVITKGAGRVAEVAARFNLDALAGRQLGIDTELNAGIINEEEAKKKRKELNQESDFYGAMDGVSKFIRGDAFVALFIVFINLIGGFLIGFLQNSMSLSETVQTFVLLTIGDGLVSQIPALIVSTATGIIITRSNSQKLNLSDQMQRQVVSHPQVIVLVAILMLFLAFLPALPALPFLTVAAFILCFFYFLFKRKEEAISLDKKRDLANLNTRKEFSVNDLLNFNVLKLELGYNLMHMIEKGKEAKLLHKIEKIRYDFATQMGVVLPTLHIKDSSKLDRNEYKLLLSEISIGGATLKQGSVLVLDLTEEEKKLNELYIKGELSGRINGVWFEKGERVAALNPHVISDNFSIIGEHIKLLLKKHLHELFGRQELEILIKNLEKDSPQLLNELYENPSYFPIILKVLKNLIMESIPIKDIKTILETIIDEASLSNNTVYLTESVRRKQHRVICSELLNQNNELIVFTLEENIEKNIVKLINKKDAYHAHMNLKSDFLEKLNSAININFANLKDKISKIVVLCSPDIRYHLKRMLLYYNPEIIVLSHLELDPSIQLKSVGTVRLLENAS